ncbi:5328_t:CDS:2 [Ambispora gerdemannii]|uniref:5328_t:CDS:1 n=1 Tax=Ambispora gerdemannii TaxID=144530 RepID=A0A9N9BDT1_9GLOM|nr:5328_t:CDS:2 [Ambispora gerdemannii]
MTILLWQRNERTLPLIKDDQKYADKVTEISNLIEADWFFENYPIFQGVVKVIGKIQNFVTDISQLQSIVKYFREYRGLERSAKALTRALKERPDFGKSRAGQNIEDEEAINVDICDMENAIHVHIQKVGTVARLLKENIVLFDELFDDTAQFSISNTISILE